MNITAAIGGASRNRVSGLNMTDNRVSGGWLGIIASGQSSDSLGVPGSPHYCDDNSIEHLRIAGNVIRPGASGTGAAIYLNAAQVSWCSHLPLLLS